jgi:hypothetical protein
VLQKGEGRRSGPAWTSEKSETESSVKRSQPAAAPTGFAEDAASSVLAIGVGAAEGCDLFI